MRNRLLVPGCLAVLAVLAYFPLLHQPLLEDDYPLLVMVRDMGVHVATHPIYAVRATSLLAMDALYDAFGTRAAPYYGAMIVLHILDTWLVYALGFWPAIGYRASLWAAVFFAVCEMHQEAVMWVASANEAMQFFFGIGALVCWLRFLYRGGGTWLAASIATFVGAMLSKESAVIVLPLLALPLVFDPAQRRRVAWLAPFCAIALLAIWRLLGTRSYSFRFNDGSFSLHAPFWLTWPVSFSRLFWFWGLLATIAILWLKPARWRATVAIGLIWAGIGLAPYSFLTYSTRIPSRQTYLASAGVAIIVGCAFAALADRRNGRMLVAACAALLIATNIGYLWTKKRAQFLDRAAPTEQLIALARRTRGPIFVRCFPRTDLIANAAVDLMAGRKDLIWDAAQSGRAEATFCYQDRR